MPYATPQDIVTRYGLTYLVVPSDDDCDGIPDNPKVVAALEDASSEVDKFLSVRFEVPLLNVDTDASWRWVIRATCDIAIYYMAGTWDTMTDLIEQRFNDAITQLTRIANGDINPGGPAVSTGSAVVCSNPRIFTRTTMKGIL